MEGGIFSFDFQDRVDALRSKLQKKKLTHDSLRLPSGGTTPTSNVIPDEQVPSCHIPLHRLPISGDISRVAVLPFIHLPLAREGLVW